jgi:tripartite-type tricarboxylate transporter receptor subunit TctC
MRSVFVGSPTLAAAAVVSAVLASHLDAAPDYPNRPIRLVVGFGVGGPTDIPARFIAQRLGEALGQPVVVENKPAAGGIVATRDVLSKPRDGYTLLLCTHFDATNTAVYRQPGYQLSDLAPISLIAKYYYAIALANAVPATDFKSFVAYAKAHPNEVTYASVGGASVLEILARQLQKLAGIKMNMIPFRGGSEVVGELVAGRVDLYPGPPLGILSQYKAKQLKILATTSSERLPDLPEVPTLSEEGIDFVRFGWLGICAGAGTPEPIITALNKQIAAIVASQDYRTLIENAGSIAASSTPQGLSEIIKATHDNVVAPVEEFNLYRD